MSGTIIVRKAAETEVSEAAVWYEKRHAGLGRRFLECIDLAIKEIAERPGAWPTWRANRPYRKYVVARFPFVVFYKTEESAIIVVAIAHSKRGPGYWLARERRQG